MTFCSLFFWPHINKIKIQTRREKEEKKLISKQNTILINQISSSNIPTLAIFHKYFAISAQQVRHQSAWPRQSAP
jgi:hypothetical protein